MLEPSDYGVMALAETLVPYLTMAASFDLMTWIIQEAHFDKAKERQMFSLNMLLGASLSIIAAVLAPLMASFYNSEELEAPLLAIAGTFVIRSAAVVPDAMLRRELKFGSIATMNFCVGVSRGVLQYVLAVFGLGYWALVIGFVYRDIVSSVWLLCLRGLPRGFAWNGELYKKALKFGLPSTVATLCWIVFSSIDNVLVGRLLGAEVLGYYAMAFYFSDLPLSKINSVLRPVLIPYYSKLKSDSEALKSAFLRSVEGVLAVALPFIAGLGVIAEEAVEPLLGERWRLMITPLEVMAAIGLMRALMNNATPLFLALGKPRYELQCNLAGALVLPPAFYVAGSFFGLNGFYACWLIIMPFLSLLVLKYLKTAIKITSLEYFRAILPALSGVLVMVFVTSLFSALCARSIGPLGVAVGKILLGSVSYFLVLWIFYRRDLLNLVVSLGVSSRLTTANAVS